MQSPNDFWYCFCRGCVFVFRSIDVYSSLLSAMLWLLYTVHRGLRASKIAEQYVDARAVRSPFILTLASTYCSAMMHNSKQRSVHRSQSIADRREHYSPCNEKNPPLGDLGGILFFSPCQLMTRGTFL